jgi:hypothetical protein
MKTRVPPVLITFALVCLAFSPSAQAVVPPPDGGYPGFNTAEGQNALFSLTTGSANTAIGWFSLFSNVEGSFNTSTGAGALLFNTANNNTAFGAAALLLNATGVGNTAVGATALLSTGGDGNTATGFAALYLNTSSANTANGYQALYNNTDGTSNTANGFQALYNNTIGDYNTALGNAAGTNLTTGSFNIDIGNNGVAGEGNTIRIGSNNHQTATYIAGIAGQTVGAGGSTCYVDNDGKLGVFLSARRFKTNIADMGAASKALLALRPVTFHYKPELDKAGIPQFGLVAEEVAEVNPDLVTHDAKGDIYTVRYEAVNAMLLNEFLKEHRKNEKQEATIAELKTEIGSLSAAVKEHAEQIQKVSAQVQMNKPASQTVLNDN